MKTSENPTNSTNKIKSCYEKKNRIYFKGVNAYFTNQKYRKNIDLKIN